MTTVGQPGSETAEIACRCGRVTGQVADAAPRSVNHAVCYCGDCQAFAHHLGRADLLDSHGGTEIVQVAPAALRLVQGQRHLRAVRLTPKGLFRWYADCCNTPVGNTVGLRMPLVGLVTAVFASGGVAPERLFGKPDLAIFDKHAIGGPAPGLQRLNARRMAGAMLRVVGWWLAGRGRPNPFFASSSGAPLYPVAVLSASEREALRACCGPHPARRADGRPA
jgi:hypothetical protein